LPVFEPVIGPVIPSLYCNKTFEIKIISFVHQEIRSKLTMEKEQHLFSTINVSRPLNPITLLVSLPLFESKSPEEVSYSGTLELHSTDSSPLLLPIKFNFQLLPLKVIIRSVKYELAFENSKFIIVSDKFQSSEIIEISIDIPHLKDTSHFVISKKSLSGNQSPEPVCEIQKNNLLISISYERSIIH
jgi:hypothetical protein